MKSVKSKNILLRLTIYMAFFLLLSTLISASAFAGESASYSHELHNHHLAAFVGHTEHEGETGVTTGLDYEYRICEYFGVGGLAEFVAGDFDDWILGIPFFFHPFENLQFMVAPAIEFNSEEHDAVLLRAGVGCPVNIGKGWSITPQYNMDFIEGEGKPAQVYGVSLGCGF